MNGFCVNTLQAQARIVPIVGSLHAFPNLRGHKWVCQFIYTHSHPQRNIEVTICKHQADSPFYVWPDVWSNYLQVFF